MTMHVYNPKYQIKEFRFNTHTSKSGGSLKTSASSDFASHSTPCSRAMSFINFNFTSSEGALTDSFSITCKEKYGDQIQDSFGA